MKLLETRARRAWAVLLVSGALSGCGDPAAPLPAEGAPDELVYSVSGAESGTSTRVELDGAAVIVTHGQWTHDKGLRTQHVRAVPTAADWAAFWAAMEDAGVQRWQREYRAEKIVDGLA